MRSKLLNSLAAVAIVAFAMIQLMPTAAHSQCPTTTLPPACSWAGTGQIINVLIPGTTCMVRAQYCYACCDGTNYFYITQMTPENADCGAIDPQLMQDAIVQALFRQTSVYGCNPCPDGETNVQVVTPGCWMKGTPIAAWLFEGCVDGPICVTTARVTCKDGVPTFSNCTSTQIGSGSSCRENPGASNLWPTGECVALDCPPDPCP